MTDTDARATFAFPQHTTITSGEDMPDAARKILLRYFQEMLTHEPAARRGDDIEGVHKMRVAARRMRTIYRIFGGYLSGPFHKQIPLRLRQTAHALGEVRDLDVFMERIHAYNAAQLKRDPAQLTPLLDMLQAEHHAARKQLVKWLDSRRYQKFVADFHDLLVKPLSNRHLPQPKPHSFLPVSYQINHHLPLLLYQCYQAVRRYDILLPSSHIPMLHRLRIDFKRLRYSLEAFSDILGEPGETMIASIKHMQSHLGDLNDMAEELARIGEVEAQLPPQDRGGIIAYRAHCQRTLDDLIVEFMPAWMHFNDIEMRRAFALAVAQV